jgi:hypothetical protein
LIEKLENALQQYGKIFKLKKDLLFHESEMCQTQLKHSIDAVKEKILLDILKIKNPNETLYEMMKVFFSMLNRTSNNLNWIFLQAHLSNFNNLKKDLENLLKTDMKKDTIDACMPFNIKYNEIKMSLIKINKNLVTILDMIKCAVDSNVKKSLINNLYQSNINVTIKLI